MLYFLRNYLQKDGKKINKVDKVQIKRSMIDSVAVSAGVKVSVKRANPDEKSN